MTGRPTTPDEDRLVEPLRAIWSEVLQRDVAPGDDFLDLGGGSLHAIRIVHRVEERYATELSVRSVLETRTVAAMARHLAHVLDRDRRS
ncbi:acyl carrier protein [Streptomyces sp. E2N166]|uniref:acyl carrier protein n=1 Tax=Streptomyces sp. E2N166 TaxID=1851909 RepID=UPI000EF6416E|nr:acyl carrier protein [Streptomyces sp. E2N166]